LGFGESGLKNGMSLLGGMGLVPILFLFTYVITLIFDYTKEIPIALIAVMLFGDFILTYMFWNIGIEFVSDSDKFKKGIGLSFMFMTGLRSIFFFLFAKRRNYL